MTNEIVFVYEKLFVKNLKLFFVCLLQFTKLYLHLHPLNTEIKK